MNDQLVVEHVKVNPVVSRATFREPEHIPVEGTALVEIVDRDGKVKTGSGHALCVERAGRRRKTEAAPILSGHSARVSVSESGPKGGQRLGFEQ
jgi:hypothetical protein